MWTKEHKRKYMREYRLENNDDINAYRRGRNLIRRQFFLNLWKGICFLCSNKILEKEHYVIHHLSYDDDAKFFGKKILPFQNPDYIAVNKKNFILLHRLCHNAFHRVIESKLDINKLIELQKMMKGGSHA